MTQTNKDTLRLNKGRYPNLHSFEEQQIVGEEGDYIIIGIKNLTIVMWTNGGWNLAIRKEGGQYRHILFS